MGDIHYFLGVEATRTPTGLFLNQVNYISTILKRANMVDAKPLHTLVATGSSLSKHDGEPLSDPLLYRSIVGALQYLTLTRLELAFAVNRASYSDADWVGCPDDRRFTTGYCVFLGVNLISWNSKKQQVVARSSIESEYRALAHATTELCWLQSLLGELHVTLNRPPILWVKEEIVKVVGRKMKKGMCMKEH
ncbi:uncharacterized mitochondrial protein AtMg00810-like [Impatiens glandulifera]|uniref:uncharacterized mitochondrial protein AtMg00810-like n=1 Tax=Impatiens glandulifera TaxID=253017 RepID=UPI001FB0B9A8|nr:uncharacterized mitochondrial protein AtMg00810-like [Impatiens glandulifera]